MLQKMPPPLCLFYKHPEGELHFGNKAAQLSPREAAIFNVLYTHPRKTISVDDIFKFAQLPEQINNITVNLHISHINKIINRLTGNDDTDYSIKAVYKGGHYFDPTPFTITKTYEAKKCGNPIHIFEDRFVGPLPGRILVSLDKDHALMLDAELQRLYYGNKFTKLNVTEFCAAKSILHHDGQTTQCLLNANQTYSINAIERRASSIRKKTKLLTDGKINLMQTGKGHSGYKFTVATLS